MATAPYLLQLPSHDAMPSRTLLNGVSAMAINAETSADAKAFAKSLFANDVDAMWDAATATAVAANADMTGWSFRLRIVNKSDAVTLPGAVVFDHTTTAAETVAVKATGTLTTSANPSDTNTVVIGGKTYTFQSSLTDVDGHVKIGASETATLLNLKNAINLGAGTPGTDYATSTTAHTTVDATASTAHTVSIRAKTAGAAGNAIATTDTLTAGGDGFAAATLTGGESAAEVSTLADAMVVALNADALIAAAAFNNTTHVLTVAQTTDSLGDHRIFGYFIPPNADSNRLIGVPGFIASQVDGGSAGDALTMTLVADTYTVPTVVALLGQSV